MRVAYTPRARRDIEAIFERGVIRWGNDVAKQVEKRIMLECKKLGRAPELGAPTDLADVRRLPIVRYPFTIFYRVAHDANRVEILRVAHSGSVQDLGKIPD